MIRQEHCLPSRGKVSAGLPSLSSEKRDAITEHGLRQVYQKALQQEYKSNEDSATASDGAIDDVTDYEKVVGMPLSGPRIITRLRRLNHNLWFEPSKADSSKTGVYVIKNIMGVQTTEFICGMETEINPEFSVRILDHQGKPKGIIAGWRRLLMRLIRQGLVSEPRAFALFGPPSRDSENWARFVQ